MKKELPIITIEDCYSYADVVIKLGLSRKGTNTVVAKNYIINNNLDTSHFNKRHKVIKYKEITKTCPVCSTKFITKEGHKNEKQTCSHSCSNTHFRSGINNGAYKPDDEVGYRRLCFRYHKKECVICKENLIVEVHHYDEDHFNNSIENLIPLCPTHHQYVHSRYKDNIIHKIDDYVKEFKRSALAKLSYLEILIVDRTFEPNYNWCAQ